MRGADQAAKMAAYAFLPIKNGVTVFVQVNSLMPTVCTGDNATAAPQTSVVIKLREKDGIALQYIGSLAYGVECQTSDLFYGIKAFGM